MSKSGNMRWEVYARLENIPPDVVSESQVRQSRLPFALGTPWRALIDTCCRELLYEQQMEYLERCLIASQTLSSKTMKANTLGKLKKLVSAVLMT